VGVRYPADFDRKSDPRLTLLYRTARILSRRGPKKEDLRAKTAFTFACAYGTIKQSHTKRKQEFVMKKIKIILIGAGDRGTTYAELGAQNCPEFELVGVADPDPERRDYIRRMFALPADACFACWEEILDRPKFADAAIIATQDRLHFAPAMRAIELGYQLLLEKPVHYRDRRTEGMVEEVCGSIPAEELFMQSGIQPMSINTLFQLNYLVKHEKNAIFRS